MKELVDDLRFGGRLARKNPLFTSLVILTLAVGIGANTVIFSVVNGVLLRSLPYAEPERVATIWQNNLKSGVEEEPVSPANFLDFQDQSRLFELMAAAEPYSFDLTGDGEPERLSAWLVTFDFLQVLGVEALHGRLFAAEEEAAAGADQVVVLDYGLWRRRFDADPDLIGGSLLLDGVPHTVIGILPREFRFLGKKDLVVARRFTPEDRTVRARTNLFVAARLRPEVSIEQARDEMEAIAARLAELYPDTNSSVGATVVPIRERMVRSIRPALLMLAGAVAFVLIIACANVANMLLFRGSLRRREFAMRTALGAGRRRLARQLFAETFLLSLAAGALGLFIANWGITLVRAFRPGNLPRVEEIGIDANVVLFCLGLSVLTALLAGVLPLLPFAKPDLQSFLQGGSSAELGVVKRSLRRMLIVVEIALAVVLLIGGGLLLRSFTKLVRVDLGFVDEKVAALEAHVWSRYPDPRQRATFFEQSLEEMKSSPGIRTAAAVSSLPLFAGRIDFTTPFAVVGRPAPASDQQPVAYQTIATSEFLEVLRIPLVHGRFFNKFDHAEAPLVIAINETLARRYWPDEDAVGKMVEVGSFGPPKVREVVGIVRDVRHADLDSEPRPEIYIPHLQNPSGSMTFIASGDFESPAILSAMKNGIWRVDKNLAFAREMTIEQIVDAALKGRRFNLAFISSFAVIALFLVVVGIGGVISFSTSRRVHEIGLRMALGARRRDIVRMVLKEEMASVFLGMALGAVGALALTSFLKSFLYGIEATDPLTFGTILTLLVLVVLFSIYLPVRKAARVLPAEALRHA